MTGGFPPVTGSLKESAPGAGKPSLTHVDTCPCCDDPSDTHGDDECEGEEDRPHGVSLFLIKAQLKHVLKLRDAVRDQQAVEGYFATLTARQGHGRFVTTRGAKARAI